MDSGQQNISEKELINAIKIRIYPTQKQKQTIKEWIGLQRWIYNKCLSRHKDNQQNNKKTTLQDLRDNVYKNINFETENTWVKDYEFDLRDEAARDFMKNLKSNLAKGTKFNIEFRSLKKQNKQGFCLNVLKKKWNKKKNYYSDVFRPDRLKSHQTLPKELECDSRLIKNNLKEYYLALPVRSRIKCDNQAKNSMIFLDPGVKNFLVGYDPSGKVITFGKSDSAKIARLLFYKRKLSSKISLETIKKRKKSFSNALLKLNKKISNLVSDLHKKIAKYLCVNYNKIYLPRLNFHNFKKLNKRSKTLMCSYRHCEFLDKLKNKANIYKSSVYEVDEAFTSKTCSNCGFIKSNLKNNNIYNCDNCQSIIGRDSNAAKNIMLRYFSNKIELDELSSSIEA